MNEAEKLLYRSNLLGADLRITNFGGGNTSAKIVMPDPFKSLGEFKVPVKIHRDVTAEITVKVVAE